MKKVKNLFLAFAIVSLLVSVSVTEGQTGNGGANECVRTCRDNCNAGPLKDRCEGDTGEDKKECIVKANFIADCCYQFCLEDQCGTSADESPLCDIIEGCFFPE